MALCNVCKELDFEASGFLLFSYSYKGDDRNIRASFKYKVYKSLLDYGFMRIMRGLFVVPIKSDKHLESIKEEMLEDVIAGSSMMFCYLGAEQFRENFGLYELTPGEYTKLDDDVEEWDNGI